MPELLKGTVQEPGTHTGRTRSGNAHDCRTRSGNAHDCRARNVRTRLYISWAISILGIALSLAIAYLVRGRSYIVASVAIVLLSMVPAFVGFEAKRPSARELVVVAVLVAFAVASRVVFAAVPYFKPVFAVIMISGMAMGGFSGFIVGAVTALVSNFMFGQGPWTPWQMLSYGLCGLAFGAAADDRVLSGGRRSNASGETPLGLAGERLPDARSEKQSSLSSGIWSGKMHAAVSISGGLFVVLVAGPVLDTSSVLFMLSSISLESVTAVYLAGFPVNLIHAIATAVALFLFARPILERLDRVKRKYGIGKA